MASRSDTETGRDAEVESLRARIAALEEEVIERTARANAAVAAAEDRTYWLDRWRVDLNALMRRPGAGRVRALLRGLRLVYRKARELREELPGVTAAEREAAEPAAAGSSRGEMTASDFSRSVAPDRLAATPVTDVLLARAGGGVVEELVGRLTPEERGLWNGAGPDDRKRLTLHFGVHHDLKQVIQGTSLTAAEPPEGVHSMARGSAAAGGSMYYADLVADALREGGLEVAGARRALDFGCSSGRVVRVLAAAYPEVEWHGSDPIPEAVHWARENLPGIAFQVGPERPPLPYNDGQFDFAFAISIWSHFAEPAALAWLEEMRRVIRPGGLLVVTTAGQWTVAHDFELGLRGTEQLSEVVEALYRRGFWFKDEFGEGGDHGIANPDWGTAFMTPDWLLARATPRWRVALLAPGRVEDAQDLLVLERR
jgi:SAM-dependent methyltransferase